MPTALRRRKYQRFHHRKNPDARRFTASEKLRIVRDADVLSAGSFGAFLRREGIYSSQLYAWRKQRDGGELDPGAPCQRAQKKSKVQALERRVSELERENRKLKRRLERAELIGDIQKSLQGSWGSTWRATRRTGAQNRPYAVIGSDSSGTWAVKPNGDLLEVDQDLLDEFYGSMMLFTNNIAVMVEEPLAPAAQAVVLMDGATAVVGATKIDAFFAPSGRLAGALLRTKARAIRFVPVTVTTLAEGRKFVTGWVRDEEPALDIEDVRLGSKVFDAEVRRLAVNTK